MISTSLASILFDGIFGNLPGRFRLHFQVGKRDLNSLALSSTKESWLPLENGF